MSRVRIEDFYDGFAITVIHEDDSRDRFSFDQEDTREQLKNVFAALGIEVEYEEVY